MARWLYDYTGFGFAAQSALNTENTTGGDFHYFAAEVEPPEYTRKVFDIAAKTGQVGAMQAPAVGARNGSIKIKMPMYGFKRSFNSAAEEPGVTDAVVSAAQVFLGLLLGSSDGTAMTATQIRKGAALSISDFTSNFGATFANNTVNAVPSATTVTVQAGEGAKYIPGQMVVWGSSLTDTAQSVSWIKSIAVDTLTLVDAPGNTPVANDDGFPSVVAYQSFAPPAPLTIRLLGPDAAFKIALVGCIPTKGSISAKAGEPPMIEIEFAFVNVVEYASGGLAQTLTVDPTLPYPLVGNGAGRLTWAAEGSAMAALHGVTDLKIDIENKINDVESHNVASGISERAVVGREIKATFAVPRSSTDTITAGSHAWDIALVAGTSYRLAVYGGSTPGTLVSIFLPSLHQAAPPKIVNKDGMIYDELQFRTGVYTADSGTGAAVDSNARIGWA